MEKRRKALVLFSGGLDSILAVEVLRRNNIETVGLVFTSYFFDESQAEESAKKIGLELIKENFSRNHLGVVKNPHYGHGAGLNPCIDCHGLMLKEAYRIMKEKKIDILATGEVLGQRPFSQNTRAFELINKLTGLKGKILRPLSGKLLEATDYEKKGLIKREDLQEIQGRSRKGQMELAGRFGIKDYPSSAGGCLLTEKEFSQKLKKLLNFNQNPDKADFDLIKIGRHFWFDKGHVILGKNKEENEFLEKLEKKGILIKPKYRKGPIAFIDLKRFELSDEVIEKAERLIWKYSSDDKIEKFEEKNYQKITR